MLACTRSRAVVGAIVTALAGGVSCGIDTSSGSFLFSVSGSADVGAAGIATLDVEIVPTGSFHDDVTVGLAGAPATLTADPLTLSGGITSGKLTLHAAAGAVIDESVVITGTTRVQVAGLPVWVTAGFGTGTLDTSFGDGGRATIPFDGKCSHFLVAQPDGKLLFPDRHDKAPGQLIRLTADGQLDGTFGMNGVVTLAGTAGGPDDVVVREDGGLIAVGDDTPPSASKSARLWGLGADGTPDPSVGSGGVVNLGGSTFDSVAAVDQKIFVAGSVTSGGWLGERLVAAGSVDPQYGNQGTVQLTFSAESAPAGHGAWLVAGATSTGNGALSLVAADGTVGASVQSGRGTYTSPLVDGNQLFVMFQTQTSTGDPQVVVQRRLPDLTPDSGFGTAGVASVAAPPGALVGSPGTELEFAL